jgi:protein-tyrosine phosphatase
MFRIFRKKTPLSEPGNLSSIPDWSFLGTDIHSHFIPGVDDGCQHIEDSLSLIRRMQEMGFRKLVTTPHISMDYFPNTPEKILAGLELVKQALREAQIDIELSAAAEYMIDDGLVELLSGGSPLLTLDSKGHILVEMGFLQAAPMLHQVLFELQAKGYKPVLAHPERYAFYHEGPLQPLEMLKENGVLFQLNTIALTGYYGKSVKLMAEKLLKADLYDFCGSDAHHVRHVDTMASLLGSEAYRKVNEYKFLNREIL